MLKEMSIEIIRKCPNNCLHCSSNSNIHCKEIISLDKFKEVIDGAVILGLQTVCFSGGEPFLHPQIVDMVNYVYEKGLSSYIYTSGIFLDDTQKKIAISESILKLISGKVTKLIFNVEAANSATYDLIMGTTGGFELMKQSIISANEFKIITEAHFVPMKMNVNQIESTVNLCENLGISKISFLRLVTHGRAYENADTIALNDEEIELLKKQLEFVKQKSSLNIRVGVPLSGENSKHNCEAANGKINIKYDGYVYPCEVFKNNRVELKENITPESIFERDIQIIYNDAKYLNRVRKYVKEFSGIKTCENCVGQYFINSLGKDGANDGK